MIMTLRNYFFAACALVALSCGRTLKDGDYTLTLLSTNDVHGAWFVVCGRADETVTVGG